MFGISGFELLLIMVFILIIFGPDKLPQMGRTLGRAIGQFKRVQQDMEHVIKAEMYTTGKRQPVPGAVKPKTVVEEDVVAPAADEAANIWTITTETDESDEEEEEE